MYTKRCPHSGGPRTARIGGLEAPRTGAKGSLDWEMILDINT